MGVWRWGSTRAPSHMKPPWALSERGFAFALDRAGIAVTKDAADTSCQDLDADLMRETKIMTIKDQTQEIYKVKVTASQLTDHIMALTAAFNNAQHQLLLLNAYFSENVRFSPSS